MYAYEPKPNPPPPGGEPLWGLPRSMAFLLMGVPLALVFTLTPVLQYMGWFLGSLTHETGHCAVAWFSRPLVA